MLLFGHLISSTNKLIKYLEYNIKQLDPANINRLFSASAIGITILPSYFITAPIMQIYGRKIAHIIIILPAIISSIIIYFAQGVSSLIIGRLFSGFTSGAAMTLTAITIGEFSSPNKRGLFLNTKTVAACLGICLVHMLGAFFDWRTVAILGLVPSVLSLLIICTVPESPAWLAYKGKFERCEKSFYWFRPNTIADRKELQALIEAQTERRLIEKGQRKKTLLNEIKNILYKFKRKDFQKPTIIVACAFIILECCGRHVFPAYAVKFMTALTGDQSKVFYYIIGVDSVILISSIGSCIAITLFSRRFLLFVTCIISNIILLTLCLYLYLRDIEIVPKDNVWVPLTLLILYFVAINLGTSSIVMALLGEIFPLEHKGVGTAMSGIFYALSLLVILKVTPLMIKSIDVYGTFFVFSMCMIVSLVYLYFFLPETKGKTLQEIEDYFNDSPRALELEEAVLTGGVKP